MSLKPESVRRRRYYTTEDSIKNWPKWKYWLARFFNADWSKFPFPHTQFEKWITYPALPPSPQHPRPPPPPPHTHKEYPKFRCHYVLILCTLFFGSQLCCLQTWEGVLKLLTVSIAWPYLFSTNVKLSKVNLRLYQRCHGGAQLSRGQFKWSIYKEIYLYVIYL